MPYALRCIDGELKGKWFSPIEPDRWTDTRPTILGKGIYPNEGVANGTILRILKLKLYACNKLQAIYVDITNNNGESNV